MRVKLNEGQIAASPAGIWQAGQVIDVDEKTAMQLVAANAATYAEPETAAIDTAAETAAKRPARKRRRRKVTDDNRNRLAAEVRDNDGDSGHDVPGDAS